MHQQSLQRQRSTAGEASYRNSVAAMQADLQVFPSEILEILRYRMISETFCPIGLRSLWENRSSRPRRPQHSRHSDW